MSAQGARYVDTSKEKSLREITKDPRTFDEKIRDTFTDPNTLMISMVALALVGFVFPTLADFTLLFGLALFWYGRRLQKSLGLPFRVPKSTGACDPDQLDSDGNPKRGDGISYFGRERRTKLELWFADTDLRTHVLAFGTTGSGKTELLLSIVFNSLVQGSGFIYIDGKGDASLWGKVFALARYLGREDDLRMINFMLGGRDIVGPQPDKISNTMNPFATGSSGMLSQLVASLLSGKQGGSGDDMWQGRAINYIESLMRPLVYLRDYYGEQLDINVIRNYFEIGPLEELVYDYPKKYPGIEQVMDGIRSYVFNLPGYDRAKRGKQSDTVREQHGYITMQLTRIFSSLADTYGHIFRVPYGEINMYDIVVNRRILVVLLPALEKSPSELSNLGKIIVAALKAMMASGLGSKVEGRYFDIIESRPTNSLVPFKCVMDEYGYYAVEGFAVVPAQARSLGFSAIFAGQDLPALQKVSKEEAQSIGANTKVKLCMALEDAETTYEFFAKNAGKAYVTKVSSMKREEGGSDYANDGSLSFEYADRINVQDLKDQGPGEMHVFWRSRIVRAEAFYASPPKVRELRLNHMLRVEPPQQSDLDRDSQTSENIAEALASGLFADQIATPNNPAIEVLAEAFQRFGDAPALDRAISSFMALVDYMDNPTRQLMPLKSTGSAAPTFTELLDAKSKSKTPVIFDDDDLMPVFDEVLAPKKKPESDDFDDIIMPAGDVNISSKDDGTYFANAVTGTDAQRNRLSGKLSELMRQDDHPDDSHDLIDTVLNEEEIKEQIAAIERRNGASEADSKNAGAHVAGKIADAKQYPKQKPASISSLQMEALCDTLLNAMENDKGAI